MDFYAKYNLPVAQQLVTEHEPRMLPELAALIKSLDSDLSDEVCHQAALDLAISEDFLKLFYYVMNFPAGPAIEYFESSLSLGMRKEMGQRVQNLLQLLYPQSGPILYPVSMNVSNVQLLGILGCICEMLLPIMKPGIDTTQTLQQYATFRYYKNVRLHITSAGDYLEADLQDLDAMIASFLDGDIGIEQLIAQTKALPLYNFKNVMILIKYLEDLTKAANIDPKQMIAAEVERVNSLTLEDEFAKEFLINNVNKDAAMQWLGIYADQVQEHRGISSLQQANTYLRIEYILRNLIAIKYEDGLTTPQYLNAVFVALFEAAAEFPELAELPNFLRLLQTAPITNDYDYTGISGKDGYWGAAVLTLLHRAEVDFINMAEANKSYALAAAGMRKVLPQAVAFISIIHDVELKTWCVAKVINMLTVSVIHEDLLLDFITNTADSLVGTEKELLAKMLTYKSEESSIVAAWMNKQ